MSANAETPVTVPAAAVNDTAPAATPDVVEALTEAVKNTAITPKPEVKHETEAEVAAHAASAAEGRRLYIGNLAYSTTDDQLKEFFTGFSMYVATTFLLALSLTHHPSRLTCSRKVNPPRSPPTPAPVVPLATPLSTSPPRRRPTVPSNSSAARRSRRERSVSSLLASPEPPETVPRRSLRRLSLLLPLSWTERSFPPSGAETEPADVQARLAAVAR